MVYASWWMVDGSGLGVETFESGDFKGAAPKSLSESRLPCLLSESSERFSVRCRANVALGFQANILERFEVVPSSPGKTAVWSSGLRVFHCLIVYASQLARAA